MLRLVCWNPELERDRREALMAAGFQVDSKAVPPGKLMTHIRLTQPDCVVIDLDRIPSHGREVGTMLRTTKSTRAIPLVFLGGEPDKTARIRNELPDASFGSWARSAVVIRQAVRSWETPVIVPMQHMQRFGASSLDKKLGLKSGMQVALLGAPAIFSTLIATEIAAVDRISRNTELVICFIRSREDLEREMGFLALHPPVWVAFPKGNAAGFTQYDVRRLASASGMTDNKVCAIDGTWSAIRFARRKSPRSM